MKRPQSSHSTGQTSVVQTCLRWAVTSGRQLLSIATSAASRAILDGTVASIAMLAVWIPWRLHFGSHPTTEAAFFGAFACLWAIASRTLPRRAGTPLVSTSLLAFAIVWAWAVPSLLPGLSSPLRGLSLNAVESTAILLPVLFGLAAVVLLPIVAGISAVLQSTSHAQVPPSTEEEAINAANDSRNWNYSPAIFLTAAAFSAVGLSTYFLPHFGLGVTFVIAVLIACLRGVGCWRASKSETHVSTFPDAAEPSVARASSGAWVASYFLIALIGAGIAVAAFLGTRVVPRSVITESSLFAGLLLGFVAGTIRLPASITRHLPKSFSYTVRPQTSLVRTAGWTACWTAIVLAAVPWITSWSLAWNAQLDQMLWLFSLRVSLLVALVFPYGIAIARIARGSGAESANGGLAPFALFVGYAAAVFSGATAATVGSVVTIALSVPVVVGLARSLPSGTSTRWNVAPAAGVAVAWGLAWFFGAADLGRTEKLLYSGGTYQAYREGISAMELPWLDEGRQIVRFDSLSSSASVWRYRGSQLVGRRDGLPIELSSADTGLSPDSPGDLVPVLLPLVLHSRAENVLLLGGHCPSLNVCHAWPLQSVTTLEGSGTSLSLLDWMSQAGQATWGEAGGPEFRFHQVDAAVGLQAAHPRRYDVIACPVTHPLAATSPSQLTQEFYQDVRSHLTPGGLFAQRVPYYDLGPEVVRTITRTFLSSFPTVMVVESIPGELVFLGTDQPEIVVDSTTLERLQAPQCRRLLGHGGWDWSVVLGRGALTPDRLEAFIGEASVPCSLAQPQLALQLPGEISRWGYKADATRQALSQHGKALQALLGEEHPDFSRITQRIEDLTFAHQIQIQHPDEPWAYRAALKRQLTERPRTDLQPVKHELKRVLHPEDQRRKDYLKDLGKAARQSRPSIDQISQLDEYAQPYDPLVSLFVHHEAAQLLSRAEDPAPVKELRHLLHTVYFSAAHDQSVRNICRAISLIVTNPDLTTGPEDRWDHLNGMLQMLSHRWTLRIASQKSQQYELVDAEHSLIASERALDLMDQLHTDAGMSDADWASRRDVLERTLVRPLRVFRQERSRVAATLSRGPAMPSPPEPNALPADDSDSREEPGTSESAD